MGVKSIKLAFISDKFKFCDTYIHRKINSIGIDTLEENNKIERNDEIVELKASDNRRFRYQ